MGGDNTKYRWIKDEKMVKMVASCAGLGEKKTPF
jgi:hypothetical protein